MRPAPPPEHALILGAGPAGLTAALELARAGRKVTVLERAPFTGGLSGTRGYEAASGTYRFDFGGHRFITANAELLALVEDLLGDDLVVSERRSAIRLGGRTYAYPLALGDLLRSAPPRLLAAALRDLAWVSLRRRRGSESFADWIESRFGRALYRHFFEGYTRKLWGIDPRQLSADWAAQRISLVDLRDVARRLLPGSGSAPRTYARRYRYPRTGFGLLFERLAERVVAHGAELELGTSVVGVKTAGDRVDRVCVEKDGVRRELRADCVISTLPLPEMVRLTGGESRLRFRSLRFLNLVMDQPDVSPYTWQYLSDPEIGATRLQEPRRRSPQMAPEGMTSLMLEIPCDEGDAIWEASDAELFARSCADLERLGIDPRRATGEFFSTRARTAYPFMDLGYAAERRRALEQLARWQNLWLCGRQGSFRYIFTDTAMEMGLELARALLRGPVRRADVLELRRESHLIEAQSIA